MQVLLGNPALSTFRAEKLLARLQQADPSIRALKTKWVYFVDSQEAVAKPQKLKLSKLLDINPAETSQPSGELYLVIPRFGTISPWSSKATDIAHNAGLKEYGRIERGLAYYVATPKKQHRQAIGALLHDRMTETVISRLEDAERLFAAGQPRAVKTFDITAGPDAVAAAYSELGLTLASDEIAYLTQAFAELGRDPTDVELMMFAQVNSEHCRHKIFNAEWVIDGAEQPKSLFKMIRNTHEKGGEDVLSAYSDNAAVLRGKTAGRFFADPATNTYTYHQEPVHSVIKVETHNHPTAIAPIPGAATGVGGEIRDEAATGRGAKTKMGLTGFSVSDLNIPDAKRPWESDYGKPDRQASALDVMMEAPIGGAAYANEFGRPNLAGYFRSFETIHKDEVWGYHKPIMLAGGLGNIRDMHVSKQSLEAGNALVVLGGPGMLIGLGGGAASSAQSGELDEGLDFSSVQRANAEIERRCQEVIDRCWVLGHDNPIRSIHDVGAGGLSNAFPELVHDSELGATFDLRKIPSAEPDLSPMELWCNESQERYVLGIDPKALAVFEKICARERCPFAVVGYTTTNEQLVVEDSLLNNKPIDLPMSVLFGKPPKMTRTVTRKPQVNPPLDFTNISFPDAVERVLRIPSVASKKFLITIGDRSVGGLVTRDQMVGPWQVPVSDVAVTATAFDTNTGEAMAVGERSPLALIDAPASARIAIAEAITNIAAADIEKLSDIKLSANWMAAAGYKQEDEKLYDTVRAVGESFCPALGITIPVGKDSLSMRTTWQEANGDRSVTSPLSLVVSAFSPVCDVNKTLTPYMTQAADTRLLLVDLGKGKNRLGGSAIAQAYNQVGDQAPDIEPDTLTSFFGALKTLKRKGAVLAYHDRSDGGLFATLVEMTFASRLGLEIDLSDLPGTLLEACFNEEIGAIIQVPEADAKKVRLALEKALGGHVYDIGAPTTDQTIRLTKDKEQYESTRASLEAIWAETSYLIQKLRDNATCADEEYTNITSDAPALTAKPTFTLTAHRPQKTKPKVAIFREQGVNGQVEMAAAFDKAGFTSVDVHLNDILRGEVDLADFTGLVACGGFSYGDVLGAGQGWAKTILFQPKLRQAFATFFNRHNTFTLGVCNGCQMLAALKEIIPGTEQWPRFVKNSSDQFEARVVNVRLNKSPSIFFRDMEGSILPVPVAHGEGKASFASDKAMQEAVKSGLVAMQYTDSRGQPTEQYPMNPNGSTDGITSLTTTDGRATILMPHPERAFMSRQLSWHPADWDHDSPWFQMFLNAREWVSRHSAADQAKEQ